MEGRKIDTDKETREREKKGRQTERGRKKEIVVIIIGVVISIWRLLEFKFCTAIS